MRDDTCRHGAHKTRRRVSARGASHVTNSLLYNCCSVVFSMADCMPCGQPDLMCDYATCRHGAPRRRWCWSLARRRCSRCGRTARRWRIANGRTRRFWCCKHRGNQTFWSKAFSRLPQHGSKQAIRIKGSPLYHMSPWGWGLGLVVNTNIYAEKPKTHRTVKKTCASTQIIWKFLRLPAVWAQKPLTTTCPVVCPIVYVVLRVLCELASPGRETHFASTQCWTISGSGILD